MNIVLFSDSFTDLLDQYPGAVGAWSMRRLSSAYTGPLIRLRADRTGQPEQDIGFDANGDLDTAAAAAFLAGDTGYIVKWYGQSGNGYDLSQSTASLQPQYLASGFNGKPVAWFGASSENYLEHPDNDDLSVDGQQDFTLVTWANLQLAAKFCVVMSKTESYLNREFLLGSTSNDVTQLIVQGISSSVGVNATDSIETDTWYFFVGWRDTSIGKAFVQVDTNTPAQEAFNQNIKTTSAPLRIGQYFPGHGSYSRAYISEVVFFKTIFTTTERTAIYSNAPE